MSDLHLEKSDLFLKHNVQPVAPVLALLGDIGNPFTQKYEELLGKMSEKFPHVLVVTGNHEHDFGPASAVHARVESVCANLKNVHALENSSVEIDNVLFAGATLWTRALRRDLFEKTVDYFQHVLKTTRSPTVMCTHMAPHEMMLGPFKNAKNRHNFYENVPELLSHHKCKHWIHGHTHVNMSLAKPWDSSAAISTNCFYKTLHFDPLKTILL
jgi:Icc-related predicted phosphoesterase